MRRGHGLTSAVILPSWTAVFPSPICLVRRFSSPILLSFNRGSCSTGHSTLHQCYTASAIHQTGAVAADAALASTAAAAANTGSDTNFCMLCDVAFTSWATHAKEIAHVARTAVCQTFIMPERSESILKHLEKHIAVNFKTTDELTLRKIKRRRRNLQSAVVHLVEEKVLNCSIPDDAEGGAATKDSLVVEPELFLTRLAVGEAAARQEVLDRVARLMPQLSASDLGCVVQYLLSTRQLARLFDELQLQRALLVKAEKKAAKRAAATEASEKAITGCRSGTEQNASGLSMPGPLPTPVGTASGAALSAGSESTSSTGTPDCLHGSRRAALHRDAKAAIIYACIGELSMFSRHHRMGGVANKEAADELVRHVLATHVMENVLSELVHSALQRIVDEGMEVWRNHLDNVMEHTKIKPTMGGAGDAAVAPQQQNSEGHRVLHGIQLHTRPTSPPISSSHFSRADGGEGGEAENEFGPAAQLLEEYFPFRDMDSATAAPVEGRSKSEQPPRVSPGGASSKAPSAGESGAVRITGPHPRYKRVKWHQVEASLGCDAASEAFFASTPVVPRLLHAKK